MQTDRMSFTGPTIFTVSELTTLSSSWRLNYSVLYYTRSLPLREASVVFSRFQSFFKFSLSKNTCTFSSNNKIFGKQIEFGRISRGNSFKRTSRERKWVSSLKNHFSVLYNSVCFYNKWPLIV